MAIAPRQSSSEHHLPWRSSVSGLHSQALEIRQLTRCLVDAHQRRQRPARGRHERGRRVAPDDGDARAVGREGGQPVLAGAGFDLDRDGTISLKEWELARMQAIREVRKRQLEQTGRQTEGVHLLRKPGDNRLFLLSNEMPDALGRRYLWWSWAHLTAFIGLGTWGLIWLGVK